MSDTIHRENEIEKSFDGNIMKRLLSYAKPQAMLLFLSIILMLLVTALDLGIPYITKIAIDDYISPKQEVVFVQPDGALYLPTFYERFLSEPEGEKSTLYADDNDLYLVYGMAPAKSLENFSIDVDQSLATLGEKTYDMRLIDATESEQISTHNKTQVTVLAISLLIFLAISFFFSFGHTYLLNYASQKIIYTLRETLYSHIQNMSLSFFDKNPVGRLVTRVSNDMDNINEMFTNVLVSSIKDFLLLGGTVVVMALIDLKLTLICFSTMPLVLLSASLFRKKARQVQRDVKVKIAKINATLAENINGMKIIQIFSKEKSIYKEFDDINQDFLDSSIEETHVYAIFRPTMNLAYSLSLGLLLWFGGGDAIRNTLELGVLVAFITYTQQIGRAHV